MTCCPAAVVVFGPGDAHLQHVHGDALLPVALPRHVAPPAVGGGRGCGHHSLPSVIWIQPEHRGYYWHTGTQGGSHRLSRMCQNKGYWINTGQWIFAGSKIKSQRGSKAFSVEAFVPIIITGQYFGNFCVCVSPIHGPSQLQHDSVSRTGMRDSRVRERIRENDKRTPTSISWQLPASLTSSWPLSILNTPRVKCTAAINTGHKNLTLPWFLRCPSLAVERRVHQWLQSLFCQLRTESII